MIADPPTNSVSSDCLPFSGRLNQAEMTHCAERFAQSLDLSTDVRFIEGDGACGLDHERRFRLEWWMTGSEPLRAALQRSKTLVYHRARAGQERSKALTDAWRRVEQTVKSVRWRRHLSQITQGLGETDAAYLRLVYSASQQVWSRAARWQAVMPADMPSPFQLLVALLSAGVWPLGCARDTLWCFIWNKEVTTTPDFGPSVQPDSPAGTEDYLFLSVPFRDSAFIAEWEAAFGERGWKTMQGPVSEDTMPPEVQLGRKISKARAVVGLLAEPDPDFGLPWWMFQELDYAAACKRPIALITRPGMADKLGQGLWGIPHAVIFNQACEREIWRWLQNNVS